jgi:PKHD-type hydroxylase
MWHLKSRVDNVENWAYIEQLFTKEECEQIITLGESLLPKTAEVVSGVQTEIRDSKVSWILPSKNSESIFQKLTDAVNVVNEKYFNFDLDGFSEGLQFTKYEAPSGKYDLHIDKIYKQATRKLSVVVQLSDPDEYEGGKLDIQTSNEPHSMVRRQGHAVLFPSYILHGVTPVTKGTRYSLVAWLTGPQFK